MRISDWLYTLIPSHIRGQYGLVLPNSYHNKSEYCFVGDLDKDPDPVLTHSYLVLLLVTPVSRPFPHIPFPVWVRRKVRISPTLSIRSNLAPFSGLGRTGNRHYTMRGPSAAERMRSPVLHTPWFVLGSFEES